MKRQCTDSEPHSDPNTAATVFSDDQIFHQTNLPYSSPLHLPQHPPLPFTDSPTNNAPDPIGNQLDPKPNNSNNHDGASVENQRRPRGRPRGSKNKPKSPNPNPTRLQLNPNTFNQPNHHILEVINGADVIDSIAKYSLRHHTSLRILHTSGAVANVSIRQSNLHSAPAAILHGRFDVLSLSAVFVNPSIQSQIPTGAFNEVAITLSIPKGNIFGGFLVGPLMASGSVFVLVEAISSLTYHRLDLEEIENNTASSGDQKNGGGGGGEYIPMYSAGFMPY